MAKPNPDPPPWVDLIVPGEGESLIRVRLSRRGAEVVRVAIEVHDETATVSSRLLRRVGRGGLVDRIEDLLETWDVERLLGSVWRRQVSRPGRRGRPDAFYAEKAVRYLRALSEDPKRPIPRLVEEERNAGRPKTTPEMVRGYLSEARRRKLLTEAPPGKAGGELTKKAVRVLRAGGIEIDQEGEI